MSCPVINLHSRYACLGTVPSFSIIKEKPEEEPAVFHLRKAAGGVRTASVSGLQARFWLQERGITSSAPQSFLACLE